MYLMKKEAQKNVIDSFLVWILAMSREHWEFKGKCNFSVLPGWCICTLFKPTIGFMYEPPGPTVEHLQLFQRQNKTKQNKRHLDDKYLGGRARLELTEPYIKTWSSQSIKIGIDLSIDKSIKIRKSDLVDINCINQSVEIDDTLVSFINLSRLYWFPELYRKIHLSQEKITDSHFWIF